MCFHRICVILPWFNLLPRARRGDNPSPDWELRNNSSINPGILKYRNSEPPPKRHILFDLILPSILVPDPPLERFIQENKTITSDTEFKDPGTKVLYSSDQWFNWFFHNGKIYVQIELLWIPTPKEHLDKD